MQGVNILQLLGIGWAAFSLIETLISEPVGGPAVSGPPAMLTFGGSTYSIVVFAQKVK